MPATRQGDDSRNLGDPAKGACRLLAVVCHIWFPEGIYGTGQIKFPNFENQRLLRDCMAWECGRQWEVN